MATRPTTRMTTRPTSLNAFTQEVLPAYRVSGANLYTNNMNDPFEEAQHNYAGPGPAALTAALRRQGMTFGNLARSGGSVGVAGPNLAASGIDPETAHSIAVNDYLARLTDTRLGAYEAEQAQDAAGRDRRTVERAAAIANMPGVSAQGRAIVQNPDGSYATGAPTGDPVNRQAIAAQMAPGLIAPPAAAPPVTFGNPVKAVVNGKSVFVRTGSDGLTYDMARRPIDPSTLAPPDEGSKGPLETIVGPDGKPIRVRQEDAIGKEPAAGTMKASTGVQKRVLNFFNRAQQADAELEGMESDIQKLGLVGQGRLAFAPNFAQSQLGQSYDAAQRAFTEARLRKDSGAAIPDAEFANDRKTYFAQPGDSQQTLEQKRRARGAMLASLGFESGQALGEFVGNEDEAKSIVQRYKDRAAGKKADAAPPGAGGIVEMVGPQGQPLWVPAGEVEEARKAGAKPKGGG